MYHNNYLTVFGAISLWAAARQVYLPYELERIRESCEFDKTMKGDRMMMMRTVIFHPSHSYAWRHQSSGTRKNDIVASTNRDDMALWPSLEWYRQDHTRCSRCLLFAKKAKPFSYHEIKSNFALLTIDDDMLSDMNNIHYRQSLAENWSNRFLLVWDRLVLCFKTSVWKAQHDVLNMEVWNLVWFQQLR